MDTRRVAELYRRIAEDFGELADELDPSGQPAASEAKPRPKKEKGKRRGRGISIERHLELVRQQKDEEGVEVTDDQVATVRRVSLQRGIGTP